jgi:hypothetical protein
VQGRGGRRRVGIRRVRHASVIIDGHNSPH